MDPESAAQKFFCDEDEEEFFERLLLIQRMNGDATYADQVMDKYHAFKAMQ